VLVGTTSIENSEIIDQLLKRKSCRTRCSMPSSMPAKPTSWPRPGAKMITIATNMAGRGTDIVLGGNIEKMPLRPWRPTSRWTLPANSPGRRAARQWKPGPRKVKALGGLRIIATERHESRRIDNQLRGRSGRQGDPGSSRFLPEPGRPADAHFRG
jgi:preprotein translocase subunit SecA